MVRVACVVLLALLLSSVGVVCAENGSEPSVEAEHRVGEETATNAGRSADTSDAADVAGVAGGEHAVHGGDSGEDGGMPDIFDGGFGLAIWTLALFIALAVILGKWAWTPLLEGLQKREGHIRHSIQETELAREEAFLSLKQYEARLDNAQAEAQDIVDKGRAEAVQTAEQLKHDAQAEAESVHKRSVQEIAEAKEKALQEIYGQAADLSTELASRIINKSLNADDHRELIRASLSKLQESVQGD